MSIKLDETQKTELYSHLVNLGRLAPSSHNTQPWQITVGSDGLILGYDPGRQLLVGDPEKRELFISLGCCIETITKAALDIGYDTKYKFLGNDPSGIARLSFSATEQRPGNTRFSSKKWEKLIRTRRSDRRLYLPRKIPAGELSQLGKLSVGTAELVIVDQEAAIKFLGQMTHAATFEIMSKQAFRDELANWVRNNWTKQPDGMPGYTQGMPGPISLLAKFVIKKTKKVALDQAKKDGKRVEHSAAIGLICNNGAETAENWISAGRLFQAACLMATEHGIQVAATSAAVILETTTKQITDHLKLNSLPIALLRFGYSKGKRVKSSPRRPVSDILQQTSQQR